MNILIYEPNSTGHRMIFLDYILAQMSVTKYKRVVLMTTRSAADSKQVQSVLLKYPNRLELLVLDCPSSTGGGVLKRIRFQFRNYFFLKNWFSSVDFSEWHLFVPFLDDYLLTSIALFRCAPKGVSWSGLVIRPRYHMASLSISVPSRKVDLLERILYSRVLVSKNLHRIFCIDPYFEKYHNINKVKYVHDPSNMGDYIGNDYPRSESSNRIKLLIYGNIDSRKGLNIVDSVISDEDVASKIELYIVGRQESSVKELLASGGFEKLRLLGRLFEINRVISYEEEAYYFQMTDLVWVFYPGSYCSSGALVRAGQAAKPVIGTREGLVGKYIEDLNMGISASETDLSTLVIKFKELMNDSMRRKNMGLNGFSFFSKSTANEFGALVVSELEGAIHPGQKR